MSIKELRKKLKPGGIRFQLILGIVVVNVVLMSLFVIQMMDRQKTFFMKLSHDRTMGLSINLANTASSYVISLELARLQKLVTTYKDIPGTEYAIVTSDDGTVLAHTNEKFLGLKATDSISARLKPVPATQVLLADNNILDIATPIINHDEIVGWARIGVSQKFIEPTISAIRQRGILYIFISLIVGSVFAVIVASGLSRSLQKLVTAAKKIKEGKRDERVDPSGSEEIRQLGTAFNQMLDEISTNEKLLSSVLQNLPVGVWILDEKGKIVSVNPAGEELWKGVKYVGSDDYNVYKAWFTSTGKEVQNHEWGASIVLTEGKPVLNQEIEIECFDKSRKTILNSAIPLRDANEKITGVITINVDITERKKSEILLTQSEEKHRALVENITDGISMADENGIVFYQSPSVARIHGYSLEERGTKIAGEFIYEEDKASYTDFLSRVYETPGVSMQIQCRMRHKDGHIIWTEGNMINLLHDESVKAVIVNFRDITERKKAAELFKHQFENSPDIILIINKDLTIESINRARPGGPSVRELAGMNAIEVLPEESRKISTEAINRCFETGQNQEIENALRGNKWVRSRFVPIGIDGAIPYVMIIATDITEQKIAEDNLKQSEERHRALIENIADGISMADENGVVFYQSPSVARIHGYSLEERETKVPIEFIYEEDRATYKEFLTRVYENPGIPMQTQVRMRHKQGHLIWTEGSMINLLHDESVKGVIVNFRDVSERKKAEEEKRKSEQNYQSLFEQASDMILLTDLKGNILEVNPGGSQLLGYTREEMVGNNTSMFVDPNQLKNEPLTIPQLVEGTQIIRRRKAAKKNGELIELESNSKRIFGDRLLVIARDITELRKAELQIAASEQKHRALTENISDAIMLINENFENIYQSPSAERIVGFTLEDGKGKKIFDFVHPDDAAISLSFFQKAFNAPGVPVQGSFRARHKQGHFVWIEGTVMNLLHDESIKAIIVNYRDISERKKAEEEIRELNEGLEQKVVERTEELYETNRVLNHRNHEITDSINYAQNIQRAVLSKAEDCRKIFPDSFVLWMPKDAVSGDFCWCYSNKKYGFIAAVDCTGHGVPGALMSIIANQMLDRVVNTYGFVEPKEILFHLDDAMVSSLKQETGIVKDGMDIALCRVDKEKKILTFAGAQRPLFYHDGRTLNEIPGSKTGVGGFMSGNYLKTFIQTEINYKEGDCFYLTSDGYYSQFGGEKKKKLMKSRFKEYLIASVGLPIIDQKRALRKYYAEWQDKEEQVDDVLVIGIRM